jgi:hypothetical protein
MSIRNKVASFVLAAIAIVGLAGCGSPSADVASENLSTAADNFEISRRVVFLNGITDQYLFTIEGRCSIKDDGNQLEVTCKVGPDQYKKHFLGLSDNVTYFVEQTAAVDVSTYLYRVIFRPATIIPDVEADLGGN